MSKMFSNFKALCSTKSFVLNALMIISIPAISMSSNMQIQKKLTSDIEKARQDYHLTGINLVANVAGKTFYAKSGYRNKKQKDQVKESALFGVASITKTFVSTRILQLNQNRQLSLNDHITRWLPQYPRWNNVTIKQLLNMTSGIYNYLEDPLYVHDLNLGFKHSWSSTKLIKVAYARPNLFKPGKGWDYSDTNYLILAKIIEKITHKSLATNIKDNILEPLHLTNTYIPQDIYPELILSKAAIGYHNNKAVNAQSAHNIGIGAAGMMMSSNDLAAWSKALLIKQNVLSKQSYKEMFHGVKIPDHYNGRLISNSWYGLGIPYTISKIYGKVYWYTGIVPWYTSTYVIIPKYQLQLVITSSYNRHAWDSQYILFFQKPLIQKIIKDLEV